jgi:HNH endonuclease
MRKAYRGGVSSDDETRLDRTTAMTEKPAARRWTQREAMLAYRLYCELPFGRLDQRNPRVIELAHLLDRSPGSVALKLVNFAHLDPALRARGIRGMSNVSALDREVAHVFSNDWDSALESTAADWRPMERDGASSEVDEDATTEAVVSVKARLTQRFFRSAVLAAYDYSCCACKINTRQLLIASHIVPWSVDVKNRTNPRNGLALCSLHDRAFDAGLMTVSAAFSMRMSSELLRHEDIPIIRVAFVELAGKPMRTPSRFVPEPRFLRHHNRNVFRP